MKVRFTYCIPAVLMLSVMVRGADDAPPTTPTTESVSLEQVGDQKNPKQPEKDKKPPDKSIEPKTNVFAEALLPRTESPRVFNPNMLGDFFVVFARQPITVFGVQTVTTAARVPPGNDDGVGPPVGIPPTTVTTQVTQTKTILTPIVNRGAFKIAENASPMPQDRAYFTFNSYSNVRGPIIDNPSASTTMRETQRITTVFPAAPRAVANVQRETLGIEKTLLDGFASIELRIPFVQSYGNLDGFNTGNVGDLTIIGKYAFVLDRTTGNVLSGGLGITAPTGTAITTTDGQIHSTLFQPWIGYIWNRDRFFVNAFHSVVIPTDSRDLSLLFNDIGLNYFLVRADAERSLRFVVASVETHVTTPLNNRSDNAPIYMPDLVVMTGGVHLGIFRNSVLTLGVATPVTGPTPFQTELFVQFNWYY